MTAVWTPEYMRGVFEQVKNWGRWGAEDERCVLKAAPARRSIQLQSCEAARDAGGMLK